MPARIEQAVVLAGGRGTRLGRLTAEIPKPLLPVGGRPFLEWILANLERRGVTRVVLSVGYRHEAFAEWIARLGTRVRLETFVEEEPLGTGGALPLMKDSLDETFYVLNGDTLFDVDLPALGGLLDDPSVDGSVALRRVPDTSRYGRVRLEGRRVTAFAEKAAGGEGLINGGVYALRARTIARLATPASIERDLLPDLVSNGALAGLEADGFFLDIGLPSTYEEAQTAVPAWWHAVTAR